MSTREGRGCACCGFGEALGRFCGGEAPAHPPRPVLVGKSLGLLFFSPSLRTRTSFEVAMFQLGGQAVHLSAAGDVWDLETAEGTVMDGTAPEHVKDAAAVMSHRSPPPFGPSPCHMPLPRSAESCCR